MTFYKILVYSKCAWKNVLIDVHLFSTVENEVQRMLEEASLFVQEGAVPERARQGRRAPTCKKCGAPMRGHKRGSCETATNE